MNTKSNQLILIVEDSEEDYETLERAFRKSGLANPVIRCCDGDEALDFLFHRNEFAHDQRLPGMILLDLNLPGTDGYEVLEKVKMDKNLRSIPVIVLTCSSDPGDISRCYASGANTYIQKPVSFEGFLQAIQRLKEYWFEIAILPR
ncbi:MAG: response regulator [Sulfuricella denitrificans]|nr:response regulator [Sulfuricella denitrificans]